MSANPLKYRMTITFDRSIGSVKKLHDIGINWLITGWWGHNTQGTIHEWGEMRDSLPVYLKKWPEVARLREKYRDVIQDQIEHNTAMIKEAKRLGMKTAIWLYAPSLPHEALDLHPEWATGETEARCRVWPVLRNKKTRFCIWTPELGEMLKDTVEELLQSLPPVDALLYVIGESAMQVYPCSLCEDIPQWKSQRRVRDLITEGARRANPDIEIITRMWQMEHPPTTYTSVKFYADTMARPDDEIKAMAVLYDDPDYAYSPDKHVPKFQESMREETVKPVMMRKLSWADAMLGQPISPWVGSAKGIADEIVEISLEHCQQKVYGFIPCITVKLIKKYVNYALDKGAVGVKMGPVEFEADWGLNMLNFDFGMKCMNNPDEDPEIFTNDWLKKRYGAEAPGLAKLLLLTENVWTAVLTYNGVGLIVNFDVANRPGVYNLQEVKAQSHIWKGAFPDGAERMSLDRVNLEKNFRKWNESVKETERMCAEAKKLGRNLSEEHRKELSHYFDTMLTLVRNAVLRLKRSFLMWAMEEGKVDVSRKAIAAIERWNIELERLIASDPYLAELTRNWPRGYRKQPEAYTERIPEDDGF